ncbi:DNA repair protein XRCC1 [Lepeophtheirus salmonis]|uniref:DNA repair protein XRCC1 n=1 Tax=Lepeophtheirus salmonis TaxID=72036 RepID=UPI001AE29286|nr:DNA repair protein XRCC1-like [Lepeophtheirus salmonis]XP_040582003.1 DNA repair protein XRCC1-like [Lepeophtheirus salmonis]
MAPLKFRRLVSFSSEDRDKPACGLLSNKKWCCKDPGESSAWVIFELEGLAKISAIDIGNFCSAFVEVQVSRSGSSDFRPLLPSSSFLNPVESRSMEHFERVRMFSEDKFDISNSKDSWDLLKVICTQPFNKRIRYGLNFVTVNGMLDSKANLISSPKIHRIGSIILKDEEPYDETLKNGDLFAKRKIKIIDSSRKLSLSEDMKSKESLASLSLAISQRKDKENETLRSKRMVDEENEERRKARKRKLDTIDKLPSRKNEENSTPLNEHSEKHTLKKLRKKDPSTSCLSSTIKEESTNVKTAPFRKLFSGVVFVISGFQNPLRSEIRSKALAMGAVYSGDWNSTCTHLICAFTNTPKFNQVKSSGGKIVKKEWIEDGNQGRKRSHWRKYALDPADKKEPPSDDEYFEETIQVVADAHKKSPIATNESDFSQSEDNEACDTDDEIDNIIQNQSKKIKKEASDEAQTSSPYMEDTDVEMSDYGSADESYKADTDVESPITENTKNISFPQLPDYFHDVFFYFYGPLENETLIKRIIVRAGGKVFPYMDPQVNFVVSEKLWDDNFDIAVKVNPKMRFVIPEYIMKCFEGNTKLPTKLYRTKEPIE